MMRDQVLSGLPSVSALSVGLLTVLAANPVPALEMCSGVNRAERKVTCIVDGDTGWQVGVKWRLLDIDAPETDHAECAEERETGKRAAYRLLRLMEDGYVLEDYGATDRTSEHRLLVRVRLPDGRDAGNVLVEEGLAEPWPNKGNRWCGR